MLLFNFRKKDYNLEISSQEITEIVTVVNKITSDPNKAKELMYFVRQDFEETLYSNGGIIVHSDLQEKLEQKYEQFPDNAATRWRARTAPR